MRTPGCRRRHRLPGPRGLHRGDRGVEAVVAVGELLVHARRTRPRGSRRRSRGSAARRSTTSRVTAAFARTYGLRYGTTQRFVSTRRRVVAAAATARATNGSRAWCPPVASHSFSGNGCSVTNTASNPAASAACATSAIAAPDDELVALGHLIGLQATRSTARGADLNPSSLFGRSAMPGHGNRPNTGLGSASWTW